MCTKTRRTTATSHSHDTAHNNDNQTLQHFKRDNLKMQTQNHSNAKSTQRPLEQEMNNRDTQTSATLCTTNHHIGHKIQRGKHIRKITISKASVCMNLIMASTKRNPDHPRPFTINKKHAANKWSRNEVENAWETIGNKRHKTMPAWHSSVECAFFECAFEPCRSASRVPCSSCGFCHC